MKGSEVGESAAGREDRTSKNMRGARGFQALSAPHSCSYPLPQAEARGADTGAAVAAGPSATEILPSGGGEIGENALM